MIVGRTGQICLGLRSYVLFKMFRMFKTPVNLSFAKALGLDQADIGDAKPAAALGDYSSSLSARARGSCSTP